MNIVKKIASSLAIAFAGAIVAIFLYSKINDQPKVVAIQGTTPVQLTNYSAPPSPQAQLPDLTQAAEKSVHAVVHITTKVKAQSYGSENDNPLYDFFFGPRGNNAQPRGYNREPEYNMGAGSGVIIGSDGYIVTNNHVIDEADNIEVVLNDVLRLTKLNYNCCRFADGMPVTLKFADAVGEILRLSLQALRSDDRKVIKLASELDSHVDRLNDAIKLYLTKVSRETMDAAVFAKESGTPVLAFSDRADSPLAPYADILIPVPSEDLLFSCSVTTFSALAHAFAIVAASQDHAGTLHRLKAADKVAQPLFVDHWLPMRPGGVKKF